MIVRPSGRFILSMNLSFQELHIQQPATPQFFFKTQRIRERVREMKLRGRETLQRERETEREREIHTQRVCISLTLCLPGSPPVHPSVQPEKTPGPGRSHCETAAVHSHQAER